MLFSSYNKSVRLLTQLGPIRAWSLLVTVFGELSGENAVDGPVLTSIMREIGIKPEATRVALHRLRNDGWITSQRLGRISQYKLTAKGAHDSAAARPRIYGRPQKTEEKMQFFITKTSDNSLDPASYTQITSRIFVCEISTVCPPEAIILEPTHLPIWLSKQIESDYLRQGYDNLFQVLSNISFNVETFSPLQIAVVRILIVHVWRRLTLKHPTLPRTAHSASWHGHDCRALVTTLLDNLPRPAQKLLKAT
ncbi:MAG TPA: PaaX family transcriptional regulator [Rhodobacteraceae bacterium]|nr:PaaX family transcriptional regulator [Tateyamaria sp.]MCH9747689.1 PaaX family transcriptional regulator [Alphaproteobacteria bacterium]MCH9832789.1 PaaX family transcriptional regulator [Alphaproteobacteria bacterium]MDG1420874.1 PaaX family transcriptional regulator C-terminal domain-containing protein [Tateyamaria sp.]HAB36668.1 PaaX family transcriptional regulator [Paracoccaceae bacterium]